MAAIIANNFICLLYTFSYFLGFREDTITPSLCSIMKFGQMLLGLNWKFVLHGAKQKLININGLVQQWHNVGLHWSLCSSTFLSTKKQKTIHNQEWKKESLSKIIS